MKLTEKLYLEDTLRKTTDYIGDKIYEDGVLKMFGHPEGRVLVSESGDFEYQYAYSDHLGNTRIVYTSKEETVDYLATMEDEYDAEESMFFANLDSTRVIMLAANSTPSGNEAQG